MATFPAKTDFADGDVLTAAQMNEIGGEINAFQGTAGKNKILNADFNINQRAFTSLSLTGSVAAYGFDRWRGTGQDGTVTYTTQAFTAGVAPVTGYESTNFARIQTSGQSAANSLAVIGQPIESVRTFANQTVTVSFWAKAASGTPKIAVELDQQFGSGGSTRVSTYAAQVTLSTSWVRYSVTAAVPSISGKTIGTNSSLVLNLWVSGGSDFNARTGSLGIQSNTFDIWGVQIEDGSTATPFTTATGNPASELAACQRYYYRITPMGAYGYLSPTSTSNSTTVVDFTVPMPTQMRVTPTSIDYGNIGVNDNVTLTSGGTWVITTAFGSSLMAGTRYTHGSAALTQYRGYRIGDLGSNNAYIGWSAEL